MHRFTLKPTKQDSSSAIILSFHSKWHEAIKKQKISVVFRKKGPNSFTPTLMYAYLTTPISAIVAKMPVLSYDSVPLEDALKIAKDGLLGRSELLEYASSYSRLMVFAIGDIEMASQPITRKELTDKYDFWPSSTFMPLSNTGVQTLDSLGKFRRC